MKTRRPNRFGDEQHIPPRFEEIPAYSFLTMIESIHRTESLVMEIMKDQREKRQNVKRKEVFYTYMGQTANIATWAKKLSMPTATMSKRIQSWGIVKAIETPKGKHAK